MDEVENQGSGGGRSMRPLDTHNIIRFNTLMGMFICPSNRPNVVSFLHGYEYGTANECRFTEELSRHIAERHGIKSQSLGWPHQIAELGERHSLDWMEAYLLVSSELLIAKIEPTASP